MAGAFHWARSISGKPQAIIARTVKGKGVSLLEAAQAKWHGKPIPRTRRPKPYRRSEPTYELRAVSVRPFEMGPATREAFGEALADAGANESIVVVDGDVNNSTYTNKFKDKYPERFFNVGIAESNMIGIAAGLAAAGKIPVAASFSTFLLSNAFDQIRMSVAFPNLNVKLVGTHAGISIGEDGPTQMAIEDVGLACAFPGMTVVVPADGPSTAIATHALLEREGPTFMRCGRPSVPLLYNSRKRVPDRQGKHLERG